MCVLMNAGRLNDGEETSNAGLIHPPCCLICAYANSDPSDLLRPHSRLELLPLRSSVISFGFSGNAQDELPVSELICWVGVFSCLFVL